MISGRKALASLAAVLFAATAAEGQTESYSTEDALLWDVTARDLIDPRGLAAVPSNVDAETGLRILPPTDSTFFTGQRLDLRIETQLPAGAPPVLETLTVNGVDITDAFNERIAIQGIGLESGTPPSPLLYGATARNLAFREPGSYAVVATVSVNGEERTVENTYRVAPFETLSGGVNKVVIFLGDAMGQPVRTAARIYSRGVVEGRAQGRLFMDRADSIGLVMTASVDSIITDSAPGMASYITGVKQPNNALNVSVDNTPENGSDNPRVETLFEFLKRRFGWKTGVVSDSHIVDATPGAVGAHVRSREQRDQIAQQYLDFYQDGTAQDLTGFRALRALTQPVDVILGAGARYWLLDSNPELDEFFQDASAGRSDNELDLFVDIAPSLGYHTVRTVGELLAAPDDRPLLGLFGGDGRAAQSALDDGEIPGALDRLVARGQARIGGRDASDPETGLGDPPKGGTACGATVQQCFIDIPSKSEMVSKAIRVLDGLAGGGGWILLVEQSQIDKLAHPLEYERTIYEVLELDNALGDVAKLVDPAESLLIVTADHAQPEGIIGVAVPGAIVTGGCFSGPINDEGEVVYPITLGGADPDRPCALQDVIGTFNDGIFPTYADANGDHFPDDSDPAIKLIIEQAGRPTYSQDYLTNPIPLNPVPSSAETARPNPARDPDGLLLTGNMPSQGVVGGAPGGPVGVAPHSTDDVPLMAFGRGARLFRGVYENSDVSVRLVAALSGGSDPDELIPSSAPGGDAVVFGRLED